MVRRMGNDLAFTPLIEDLALMLREHDLPVPVQVRVAVLILPEFISEVIPKVISEVIFSFI